MISNEEVIAISDSEEDKLTTELFNSCRGGNDSVLSITDKLDALQDDGEPEVAEPRVLDAPVTEEDDLPPAPIDPPEEA